MEVGVEVEVEVAVAVAVAVLHQQDAKVGVGAARGEKVLGAAATDPALARTPCCAPGHRRRRHR